MERLNFRLPLVLLFLALCVARAGTFAGSNPFEPDEVMQYDVRWKPPVFFIPSIHAGHTTLHVRPHTTYDGAPAFHFSATAKSDGFLPKLGGIDIDDAFESIVAADNFCARKVVKMQREGDRKRDIVITFNPEQGTTRVVETDLAPEQPRVIRDETLLLPSCAVDVLSIFYAARRLDLDVGKSFNLTLSDNGVTRPITITVAKREMVETGEGTVPAFKIETGSAMGLFSRGGSFSIWYSIDPLHIPVKFEAKVKFGRVYGTLKSYKGAGKLKLTEEQAKTIGP
ncbi:MAG: DUF3108 domain-containing protein [Acidobacteria bacterium]|nr:DUF3108 domain-containing protein [Acidobacteriota bacterium]